MRPIGLMIVLTSAVRGGVEEVVLGLLQRLDPSEFRLSIAAPRPLLDALAPDLAGVRLDTLDVEAESFLHVGRLRRLAAFMRRIRPDVVNPHLFRTTAVAAPLARAIGIGRVVETYHGREAWRQGALRGRFLVDRTIARLVTRVIAVSRGAADFLIHGKGYPAHKVVVVPNGRDLTRFTPGAHREAVRKELGLDRDAPVVGVVGRLETQKGHVYLLDAWPEVVRAHPDARLLVVGEGSLHEALRRQARDAHVADSVIFTGFRSDVPRILDASDVLALPSLHEGMPLTVIEAAAAGRPVVATAVDGTPEVVRDGETGYLVPPADPAALSRALLAVLGDPDAAARMGREAHRWAHERFDVEAHVEATARVYREVARG
ncbi:MAG TPA: glycosyltransferase [Candidatus Acidoferrum sp.]|nr:glycosyltransferase [Candidatus Acidoferrum sp.]